MDTPEQQDSARGLTLRYLHKEYERETQEVINCSVYTRTKSFEQYLFERIQTLLEDRNRLLDLIDGGPLSSNEWQIRALRAEAALARFQSEKPELGDLSFREMIRSEMIEAYLRRGY